MKEEEINHDLIEKVAEQIHNHWMIWAKELLEKEENISLERKARWEKECFTDYENLSETMKDLDRKFAKDLLNII